LVIIIPSAISVFRYNTIRQNNNNGSEIVIIQPNTDPYTDKYTVPFEDQLKKVITMAKNEITDKTRWVITPETTIDDPANLDDLTNDKYVKMIKELITAIPWY
jgi:apolipoprotein N-acyltransferase